MALDAAARNVRWGVWRGERESRVNACVLWAKRVSPRVHPLCTPRTPVVQRRRG